MRRWIIVVLGALALGACVPTEHRDARDRYNEGVAALARDDYAAAETALLAAWDQAGVDSELRFRAQYDLGIAYAGRGDASKAKQPPDLEEALRYYQQAQSLFRDAGRIRPDDADRLANLATVTARAEAVTDELRRGDNTLEKRLDRSLDGERTLLDGARAIWAVVKARGTSGDPLASQRELTELANQQRTMVADVGVIQDLAADEIDAIGKKPADQRTQDEQVRVAQLKSLDLYLLESRARLAESRRTFQELAAGEGVERAVAALTALKRARDQLLDPVTVMRGIAQDHVELMQQTAFLSAHTGATVTVGPGAATPADADPAQVPAWLTSDYLGAGELALRERLGEVQARFEGALAPPPPPPPAAPTVSTVPTAPTDPAHERLLAKVRAALPSIIAAGDALQRGRDALIAPSSSNHWTVVNDAQEQALIALAQAIEQFADLKQTIELAWADGQQAAHLLEPAAADKMPAAERGKQISDAMDRDAARLARMAGLIVEGQEQELAQAAQQGQAPGAQGAPGGTAPAADPGAANQAQTAVKERYTKAEALRAEALVAIDAARAVIDKGQPPTAEVATANEKLTELRRLFYSILEHLQELARNQTETKDDTGAAQTQDDVGRAPLLPGLVTRQDEHATMAQAIQQALAQQADQANQGGASGATDAKAVAQAQEMAKKLTEAATEVTAAGTAMGTAKDGLVAARDATGNVSYDLQPAVDAQGVAIEHLMNAIKLLSPPPKQDPNQKQDQPPKEGDEGDKDKQDKQDNKAKAAAAKPDDNDPTGKGAQQRARDTDADRQRERRKRQRDTSEPVDKDW